MNYVNCDNCDNCDNCGIWKLPINLTFFFYIIIFSNIYKSIINIIKKIKKGYKKKLWKDMKVFLKKKKKKSDNMVVNNTKMYQKIKKKAGWI